jgi:hypothetical protein
VLIGDVAFNGDVEFVAFPLELVALVAFPIAVSFDNCAITTLFIPAKRDNPAKMVKAIPIFI